MVVVFLRIVMFMLPRSIMVVVAVCRCLPSAVRLRRPAYGTVRVKATNDHQAPSLGQMTVFLSDLRGMLVSGVLCYSEKRSMVLSQQLI
jgi:hypothetical protein